MPARTSSHSITRPRSARTGYCSACAEVERAGIAINPQTPTAMLVDLIADCDQILVMSVEPGFRGQDFIEQALEKVSQVRKMVDASNPGCDIEVDGGIGPNNIERAVAAGATMLVAGSSIFKADDPSAALRDLRRRVDASSKRLGGDGSIS
jgi:ribulose-phosphate 3-epimerase